jgi:hypothetical protein
MNFKKILLAVPALGFIGLIGYAASRPVVKPNPPDKGVCLATYPELATKDNPIVAPPPPPKPASEPVAANEPSCGIGDCSDLVTGAAVGLAVGSLLDSGSSSKKSSYRSSYSGRRR